MNNLLFSAFFCLFAPSILFGIAGTGGTATAAEAGIEPRPVVFEPKPVGRLRPELRWMQTQRIRALWIQDKLYENYGTTDKSKAQVMAESGFNVAVIGMQNDPLNRSFVPGFNDFLPANLKEARKHSLAVWIKWRYGSDHQEPYNRYRPPFGKIHGKTCCPLDAQYIERHVGRWAVKVAEAGADGFVIDTEMYLSDEAGYYGGPCVCDHCFRAYLDEFNRNEKDPYDGIAPEDRGKWLLENGLFGHYRLFSAKRIEDQYDALRARCHALNPAFIFGYAPTTEHIPGITRGLGTAGVPCIIFGESEYTTGPTAVMQHDLRYMERAKVPGMYICGLWISRNTPEQTAERALTSSLYGNGWWAYYGNALLNYVGAGEEKQALPGGYGRCDNTSADDYLKLIASTHKKVNRLLRQPQKTWPPYPAHPEMGPTPSGTVTASKGTISIDGIIDEEAWQNASQFNLFRDRYDKKKGPENTFRLCWDKDALYFAAHCPIPAGEKLSVEKRGRDHPHTFRNDGLELFLDPTGSGARYAHIVLSALGDIYDSRVDFAPGTPPSGDICWNIDMEAGVSQTETEYIIEARIPFDDFLEAPRIGKIWRVNVCRHLPAVQTWSPTFGIFHNPSRFGTISFSGD